MEPVNRSLPNDEIAIPDENREKAPTYNQWSAEELEEHGPCEHWQLAELKADHNARRYSLEHLKIRLCVRWEGHSYPMQTKLYDINTTRKAFMNAWGPSYHDDDNCYELQLVGLNPRTKGFQKVVARRPLTIGIDECPVRVWKIDSSQYGGKLPESLEDHIKNREEIDGQYVDPDSIEEDDGVWEADETRDSRGYDRNDARGGRGRDRDPMNDRGPHDPFAGAVAGGGYDAGGGYGPAAQGFPGAGPRNPYGAAPNVVAPPPPKMANGHLWTGSPPGFNPPEPGEWKHCPSGRAEWVGNHYEPAPMAAPTTVTSTAPAEELPPIVNGFLRMGNGQWVPVPPQGVSRVAPGQWVPNPDPNAAITNPARQLASSAPPMPERSPEDPDYYEIDGAWVFAPHGVRFRDGVWQPKIAPPTSKREEKKESLIDSLASEKGVLVLTVLKELAGGVFGGRREDAAAERERVREEARLATERAKAEADAAKENARVLADAQKEAARLQADAQIKAAELAAQRDRDAREADERRRSEMAEFAREDRKREEDRREEQRKREHEIMLKRTEEEAIERRRREDREREERAAAETRMEKIITIATAKPAALPVADPALEALKLELATARREASKGGDFASEFKRMKSLAEAMGAKFGEGAGPASDPDVFGPLMVTAAEKTFELVERFIKSREAGAPAAAAQHVNITQSPRPPGPPRAGFIWGWDGVRFVEVPIAPMQPQLPPTPAPVQLPQPQYTAPPAPEPAVTESAPYVPPATQPEPVAEPQWSSVPAEEQPEPVAEPPAEVTPPAEF